MANVCNVCQHENRKDIDRQYLEGQSAAKIAKAYELGYNSVYRHVNNCITKQLAAGMARKEANITDNLLQKIEAIVGRAEDIFQRNYKKKRDDLALRALSEQRNVYDLLAKIVCRLHELKEMEKQSKLQLRKEHAFTGLKILTDKELYYLSEINKKINTGRADIDVFKNFTI